MKLHFQPALTAAERRAPRGARGLKLEKLSMFADALMSRPARGAWIETWRPRGGRTVEKVAPRAGRVD